MSIRNVVVSIPLLAILLLCICQLSCGSKHIYVQEIGSPSLEAQLTTYHVTNGEIALKVRGDNSQRVVTHCEEESNTEQIAKLMTEGQNVDVSDEEWVSLLSRCEQLNKDYDILKSLPQPHPDNSAYREKREVRKSSLTTLRPDYIPKGNKLGNVFILNGTNWCGTGHQAKDFDDLGYYADADKCCRSHDYCKDFIPMFSTKYKYSNSRPYTISYCECDYDFYTCLKNAGGEKADEIGDLFFHTIAVPCFNFEYGEYCPEESSFLFCGKDKVWGETVTLNYLLSEIWEQQKRRVSLP